MDKIHCIEITFPSSPASYAKDKTDCSITNPFRGSFRLPKLIKPSELKISTPMIKKQTVSPEALSNTPKTTINHIEEKFSSQLSCPASPNRRTFIKKDKNSQYYLQFYDIVEKQKIKRIGKHEKIKVNRRNNPWRYNAASADSVFDVALLAEKTFNPNRRTSTAKNEP